ncbi:MAG TPA: response regulator [Polyangiaceae bacterium]|nr:response regulator [Polyangiaceae bacterium]
MTDPRGPLLGSLRARLLLIVGTATLALLLTLVGSALIGAQQARDLRDVEQRLVPKLGLGPKLETEFDHLHQAMQDAVAAQDLPALDAAADKRNHIFELIAGAREVLDPSDAAQLRWTIHDYYQAAEDVSRRLIAGDTGEEVVERMARMQAQQAKVEALIKQTTGLSRGELAASFALVERARQRADRFRLTIGLTGLVLVLALSLSLTKNVFRGLRTLSGGLARFATGNFDEQLPSTGLLELANLAREANQMAGNLRQLARERDRADWLKESQVLLSNELREGSEPSALAQAVVLCLARRTGAVAAALHLLEDGGLRLHARFGVEKATEFTPLDPLQKPVRGEGLLIEALRSKSLLAIEEVPEDYLRVRTGLGEGSPRSLLLLPLSWADETVGVLELALFKTDTEDVRELLSSVQEMLVIGLQAARSREALREALERSQQQAERLAAQEEELRANNQELQSQHEELRVANAELEAQREILSQQNSELEEARHRLQAKAEELSKMSTYKSQFLANMSHELRTPLNSMLLLSQLLAQNEAGSLSEKQVEYSKTIHAAGHDLLNLINQVLDLAKIEAGRQDVKLERVELTRFVDHARRVFEPLASEKGLKLEISLEDDCPTSIVTDPLRVERILTNLLGNAIKFTDRGRVALRISRPPPATPFGRPELSAETSLALTVSDTGIGIPPEARERVFAPFEQLESHANRRYSGTGLGLAIARESVTLLGGELQLVSEPGVGSSFTCYLPIDGLALADSQPAKPKAKSSVTDDRDHLASEAPHLLVIEDDPVLAEQLVEIIHARRLKALVANSGEEGLLLASRYRPQGIVLDVKLPDVDGWTVMERLRTDPRTREIPVHFVSGVESPERGLALGAIGYLMKPASHTELALAVRALAPGSQAAARRVLVVEDSAAEGDSLCERLRQEHFEALRVGSAREALDALEESKFGCMILDLGLPDMDGLAVLETLRARGHGNAPRVIVHTGRALNKRETKQLEAYAEAVVLKEGDSAARLLEEIRLFVSHVKDSLSPRARSQIPPPPAVVDLSLEGVTVLLAEDDMRTVYALSALLTSKGATVLVADSGREALALLAATAHIDVVLMDIMMPEMDGYEATRRLREDPRFAKLPVIALTAKSMKGERERCLEVGASDYLTKPIDSDKLLQTVQAWLPKGGAHAGGS